MKIELESLIFISISGSDHRWFSRSKSVFCVIGLNSTNTKDTLQEIFVFLVLSRHFIHGILLKTVKIRQKSLVDDRKVVYIGVQAVSSPDAFHLTGPWWTNRCSANTLSLFTTKKTDLEKFTSFNKDVRMNSLNSMKLRMNSCLKWPSQFIMVKRTHFGHQWTIKWYRIV